eukprot:COSAG01_NODE_352_length_18424_cov_29.195034_16_plen_163_part_00
MRYDPAVAWKVVFVAMGMATVVAVGLPAAAAAFAAAGATNAAPVLRRRRSAHGWLLREYEVVREFKRAGVRIGRKYVRSCMRRYLGAARHTQYVPAGCGGAAGARGGALRTQEAGFRYRSLSPVIVASGPQVSLSLSGGAISAGHTILYSINPRLKYTAPSY